MLRTAPSIVPIILGHSRDTIETSVITTRKQTAAQLQLLENYTFLMNANRTACTLYVKPLATLYDNLSALNRALLEKRTGSIEQDIDF